MKKLACFQKLIKLALKKKLKARADKEKLILRLKISIHELSESHEDEIERLNEDCNKKKVNSCLASELHV